MKIKKIDNKGYMIVEIIISATLAMIISYFMMDLIIKLKEKYDYVQNDTELMSDKIIITNEILGDLYNKNIISVSDESVKDETTGEITEYIFNFSGPTEELWLKYEKSSGTIKYCSDSACSNIIYQKKFDDKLKDKSVDVQVNEEKKIASFIVTAKTLTSTKDYGIKIILPINSEVLNYN